MGKVLAKQIARYSVWIAFAGIASAQAPTIGNCTVFPANNIWNTRIDQLPVHPSSSTWVTTIGTTAHLHPDFGSGLYDGGPIGIPFVTVSGSQTKYAVSFTYADESDPGPYAVPLNAPIEGGSSSSGDRHTLAIDTDNCILYELYAAYPQASSWQAGSGAIYNLLSNALRPSTWTSADAAGLPIFPGLVRYDEIVAGVIRHAIRFTVPQTQKAFVWPARHQASSLTGSQYPPMGARFRLKKSFDISGYSAVNKIILTALQQYGMFIADNGSSWYISGAPDDRWNNDDLHVLNGIAGSNFEAVDDTTLMVDPNSGQATQNSVSVTVTPGSASVAVNGHQQFSAAVNGNSNQSVTWDVNGTVGGNSAVGFIDSISGAYTAPALVPSPATVTVHATSKAVTSAVGNASLTITSSAPAPTPTLSAVSVSPSQGTGTSQTFTFTFSDSNGAAHITSAMLDIASSLTPATACYLYYGALGNAIYLANNAGTFQTPLTVGTAGTASNSQCSLNAGASSVMASGNTLTLRLALSFQAAFAGNKNVYMTVTDGSQTASWVQRGSWTVSGGGSTPPTPSFGLSFTPASQSITAGGSANYTVRSTPSSGFNGSIALKLAALPSGVTATFSPTSITASGSSTLTVHTTATAAKGTTTLLVTGTSGALSRTASASVTIGSSSGGGSTASSGPPSVAPVTPASGSALVASFSFKFSDPSSATHIVSASINIGTSTSPAHACYLYFNRANNAIYLGDDNGALHSALKLGTVASASNSQCGINTATASASAVGKNLTLQISLTFKAAFSGSKKVYAKATNGQDSGWVQAGTWIVP